MLLDGLSVSILRSELEERILDGIIDGIHQVGRYDILLVIRKPGESHQVLISANPEYSRIHLTKLEYHLPAKPSLFCNNLRKYLNRGRIVFVEQPGCERMISVGVKGYDEFGNEEVRVLTAEVMGRHSNIILYRQEDNIIYDCIVRVTHGMSSVRQVVPGVRYELPPGQDKMDPFGISRFSLISLLSTGFGNTKVYNLLLRNIAGISPQLAREIVAHAGYAPDASTDEIQEDEVEEKKNYLERIANAYFMVMDSFRARKIEPTVVKEHCTGRPIAISAIYPRQYTDALFESFQLLSDACDAYYGERVAFATLKSKKDSLHQIIRKMRETSEATFRKLEDNLGKCENSEVYLKYADILGANLHRIKRGDEKVLLDDFYAGEGKTVEIPLDPKLTPVQNMQNYYKLYAKAKRGLETVKTSIAGVTSEMEYLDNLELSIEQAASVDELEEVELEMKDAGYIKENKRTLREVVTEPFEFRIGEEFSVLVGKNNRQNDRITTRVAHPDDLWFHVKDFPGSHVVLRTSKGRPVPEDVLRQAAEIAAYYSKAKDADKVAVDYTFIKYVSKPRNAKPGKVIYRNHKTIYVSPRLPFAGNK